jgi:guanylate kinase
MNEIIKTKNKGSLIVISGPSGAGKDSIVERLLKINKKAVLSVSATTRSPRENEVDGVHYHFLTKEDFLDKIDKGEFLEYAEYNGNFYGTPKFGIKKQLDEGNDVLLVIEIQGALKIKELIPEALFIFIMPPSMSELRRRLIGRQTEDREKVMNRFKTAYKEINEVTKYNYVVINDDLDEAVNKVNSILLSEKCRVDRIEELYLGNQEEELHEILIDKSFDNRDIDI